MKNRGIAALIVFILVFTAGHLLFADGNPDEAAVSEKETWRLRSVEGKTLYTKANIFYQRPLKIFSTNFLTGKIFPIGSKVKVTFAGGGEIEFRDEKGDKYIMVLRRKHMSYTVKLRDYFNQYFSFEDPMRPGGPFDRLSEIEQRNIRNGTIEPGMSKTAVLMAYGYPPSHRTPDLKDDKWIYWRGGRKRPISVYFKNDQVETIVTGRIRNPE